MKTEGLSLIEQVDLVMKDMQQLIEDLNGTDYDLLDVSQLKKLRDYSKGFSIDIAELVIDVNDFENRK